MERRELKMQFHFVLIYIFVTSLNCYNYTIFVRLTIILIIDNKDKKQGIKMYYYREQLLKCKKDSKKN